MSLQPGQVLDHYRIVDKLGEGGMGEVWRARDEKLDREVAVKVLPADVANDPDRLSRFEREAKALAALSHPNILAIFEFGHEEGIAYVVTELLQGETLRATVTRQRLGWRKAVEIAAAIADGLAAAHGSGVVHRDLKPENVFLTKDGRVKVLDFGLARVRAREAAGEADTQTPTKTLSTDPGTVLGTAGYMAPEQVRGQVADARSDIFALGCVAYEMASGQRAFARDTAAETMSAILNEEPAEISSSGVAVPGELSGTIRRCLEKRPEARFQSASDLAYNLRMISSGSGLSAAHPVSRARGGRRVAPWAAVAALCAALVAAVAYLSTGGVRGWLPGAADVPAIDSLAVLPFVNASADPDTEYLSDGISESLINTLSQLPDLKVMSSASVFRYKGQQQDVQAIGHELGVQAVLTGRLLQRGDSLSISVELVDTRDNTNVWGERYNRTLDDIIELEQEITGTIADKLRMALTAEDRRRLTSRHTDSSEAYQLYLKGRHHWNRFTFEDVNTAIGYFEQAIEKDPGYAAAYAGLADCYTSLGDVIGALPPREAVARAKEAALEALEIDDEFAEAHASLGYVRFLDWDWDGAEAAFTRALELDSDFALAHDNYSLFLAHMGRFDEAIHEVKRALELDPLALVANSDLSAYYMWTRRVDDARRQIEATIDLDANYMVPYWNLGIILRQDERYDEAIAQLEKARALSGDNPVVMGSLGRTYAAAGQRDEALEILRELDALAEHRYVSPVAMAHTHIGLGQMDQAIERLEAAFDQRDFFLSQVKADFRFDPLRSDPRFQDLLERMNFPD